MNKKSIFSFKNVVIFVFCFVLLGSLALSLSLSKKASGLDVSEPVGGWPEEEPAEPTEEPSEEESSESPAEIANMVILFDLTNGAENAGVTSISADAPLEDQINMPANLEIGETWTGPSGETYIAIAPTSAALFAAQNFADKPTTTLIPYEEEEDDEDNEDKEWNCKACNASDKCVYQTFSQKCDDTCKTDAECQEPSDPQYRCRQCRGTTCAIRYSSAPCASTCRTNTDCGGTNTIVPPGSHSPRTTTTRPSSHYVPPTSPPPTCQIIEFSINGKTNVVQDPLIVWVNAFLKGYFSVNDTCKTCRVSSNDTWGYPLQSYPITTLDSDYTETFKIDTAGTYTYTLECIGTDPEDIAIDTLSLQTVQAVNLPWWREIIPNLGGFLRGL